MPIAIEVTAEPIEVMAEPIEVTAGGTLDLQDQCERNPLCLRGFRHHGKGGKCSGPKSRKACAWHAIAIIVSSTRTATAVVATAPARAKTIVGSPLSSPNGPMRRWASAMSAAGRSARCCTASVTSAPVSRRVTEAAAPEGCSSVPRT